MCLQVLVVPRLHPGAGRPLQPALCQLCTIHPEICAGHKATHMYLRYRPTSPYVASNDGSAALMWGCCSFEDAVGRTDNAVLLRITIVSHAHGQHALHALLFNLLLVQCFSSARGVQVAAS